jgi:hypothetical protein
LFTIVGIIGLAAPIFAQPPVDLRNTHERLICVVPMVGAGTPADPRRPLYAPLPQKRSGTEPPTGILAFSYLASDDGRFALVEFVARDRAAFKEILEDRRADMKVFEKGAAKRPDIEAEFGKFRKNFDLDRFGVRMP